MKPIVAAFALAVVGVAAMPLTAQQSQAPPNEPAHKIFVLTGCLTGSPAETAAFKLTGAVPVGQAPKEGPAAGPDGKVVYELLPTTGLTEQGIARPELQTHVGRKVEVTVRPVEVSPGPARSSSSPVTSSTAKPEDPAPTRYTVTKITSVAGSCQ
jgi:hypothetical protein